jgi:arsenate reductase
VTETSPAPHPSVDQTLAPRTAAERLARQFSGVFGAETIERFLHTSCDQFAERAAIPHFLPLLAERFARQRLTALAQVDPAGQDLDHVRPIQDEIERRVRILLTQLNVTPA